MSNWAGILLEPARLVMAQITQFLVNVLLVIIILIIGWVVSCLVKAVVTKGLKGVKLDELSEHIELDSLLKKGGITHTFSELIGVICYWLLLLVAFVIAINAVGLTIAAELLNKIVLYVPNVISAVFVLILGMFVATLLRNIIQTAASNAGLSQGTLLSKIVEVVVIVFAVFVGLEQLNIGVSITELTLGIILGSLGLGSALAFGLGCKDIAGKFVAELIEKMKSK